MHLSSRLNDAFKQAVTPGPDRSLAGVALGAAARPRKDAVSDLPDVLAAFGTVQLDSASKPVTSDTVMWIASCSKLVTTVAALQCIERGLFSLDNPDDVDRLLPEWKDPQLIVGWNEDETPICESTKEKVTVRMLLTHTSGFAYDFMSPDLMRWRKGRGEGSIAMRVPMVESFTTPISFKPGTSWSYGCGLDLMGLMIARANDEKLETYFRRNIFDVLGMNSTSFHPTEHTGMMDRLMPRTSRLATGELIDGDAPDAVMRAPIRPADEFGGGGLFSTAADYLKLLKSILLDDGQLLKPESIDALFTPCLSPSQKKGLDVMLSIPQMAAIMIPGEPLVGTPGASDYSHSLGGLVNFGGSDFGLQPGWLAWGGAPNLHWYIDRKGGTCGIFATQLFPPGELKHAPLWKIFQEETVKHFA